MLDQIGREFVGLVALDRAGRDLFLGEIAHRFAE